MHEMPIAIDTVARVVEVARVHHATCVTEIEVEVGPMRQVVPEALELAFEMASKGTPADGAKLTVTETTVVALCNTCNTRFEPDVDHSFLCPQCGQADARIVAGNDIILKTVVCETDQEVSA